MSETIPTSPGKSRRDVRIDVFRGAALLMIFVDHIPNDLLNKVTLHNFGFSDAAEVFVLLAGFSAMLAYSRVFERDGTMKGLRKIAVRCGRIYLFQVGLLLITLFVVKTWTTHFHIPAGIVAPILGQPLKGIAHGLTLRALPSYLDILPLYVVLLAAFPLLYLAIRRNLWLGLGLSAAVWALASIDHHINLPNWLDTDNGWYFDPFAWQFLFAIGAALSIAVTASNGALPRIRWLMALSLAYLAFAFMEAAPWHDWSLPDLRPVAMVFPDKSRLNWLRIVDVLALFYVLMSSRWVARVAASRWLRPVEACGRHSLEVFSLSCVLSLFGRLVFRTDGVTAYSEVLVNLIGFGLMGGVALWMEQSRLHGTSARPAHRWLPAFRH